MMDEAAQLMAMPVVDDPVSSAFRAYRVALAARRELPGRIDGWALDCRAGSHEQRLDLEGAGGAGGLRTTC